MRDTQESMVCGMLGQTSHNVVEMNITFSTGNSPEMLEIFVFKIWECSSFSILNIDYNISGMYIYRSDPFGLSG